MVNFDVLLTALIRKEENFHSSCSLVRHRVDVAKIKKNGLKKIFFLTLLPANDCGNVPKICKRYKSITQRQMGFVFYSNIRIYCLKSISLL